MPYSSKPAESDMSGMIQSCGALLVLSADLGQVLQASDNLAEVAGVSPDTALAHGPGKVLGHALWQRLSRELQGRARLAAAVVISRRVAGQVRRLQVDLHRQGERVFVEIEPLHASSNKRRLLAAVSGWLAQLAAADHPDRLLETLVEGVQSITGHDRVLVASFDAEGHGAVVAESVAAKVPSLMGMRFPASDFPPQMREIFERQAVCSVPDVEAASVPLRPRRDPLTGAPVDLSSALLRGLSSAQRHYLRAMQVRAVLTVAMQGDAGLWGLLLFRGEQRETHAWAGMPRSGREAMAPATQPLLGQLFEQWREEVRGRSAPWERIERLAAMDLAEDLGVMAAAQQIHRLYADLRREREALAEANRRLERLAHYDPLTQSWNRYSIERALDTEIGAAEQFVVVASHCGLESGLGLAERLRAHVAALSVPGLSRRITISIGVATWQPGDTRKSLLARADAAMYRAKHGGRNRVES
ncbi:diguanylate cyclase domain-containing protein [Halomonas sp. A11-A]|uniref:diguanylate cyclase domain-containing protein n=1 Tax=Halomonas sp. A11-A TaxID=2183985 RepID=UPI000D71BC43|nr:diguanylate cyclase [Halomonas sp. A11-A]PWV78250.1 diguanylate cyclase (GGDEF)-like protein [Halomonas sp. A11-A]